MSCRLLRVHSQQLRQSQSSSKATGETQLIDPVLWNHPHWGCGHTRLFMGKIPWSYWISLGVFGHPCRFHLHIMLILLLSLNSSPCSHSYLPTVASFFFKGRDTVSTATPIDMVQYHVSPQLSMKCTCANLFPPKHSCSLMLNSIPTAA